MRGLVWIWASATLAMFGLYVLFLFLGWILGVVDQQYYDVVENVGMEQSWISFHDYWIPKLRSFFGYLTAASFISLLIYIVVNSARREPVSTYY